MREWGDEQNSLGVAVCTHMLHLAMLEQNFNSRMSQLSPIQPVSHLQRPPSQ